MRPKWEIQETINSDIPFSEALNKIKNLLLYNRGMNSIQELNFPLDHEYDPFLLPDMQIAVSRISKAINKPFSGLIFSFRCLKYVSPPSSTSFR